MKPMVRITDCCCISEILLKTCFKPNKNKQNFQSLHRLLYNLVYKIPLKCACVPACVRARTRACTCVCVRQKIFLGIICHQMYSHIICTIHHQLQHFYLYIFNSILCFAASFSVVIQSETERAIIQNGLQISLDQPTDYIKMYIV